MRYRFEKASQIFELASDDISILPLREWQPGSWAELPALVYPSDERTVLESLEEAVKIGLSDVVCENLYAVRMAGELGLRAHGGLFLNIMNSGALATYRSLGLIDATLSMELSFHEMKKLKPCIPVGAVIYGYLPLMKFRACPKSCDSCGGLSSLRDRMGEAFPLICRDKKYSELLNCVPLYVGDRQLPRLDFKLLYFSIESRSEAERIRDIAVFGESFPGRKTAGLYFRELL